MTTRRAVLAGGSLLTSVSLFRNIPIAAAQPVEAGGCPAQLTAGILLPIGRRCLAVAEAIGFTTVA
jgi:hypothetical protein